MKKDSKELAIKFNKLRGQKYTSKELNNINVTRTEITAYVKAGILIKDFHGKNGCTYTVRNQVIHYSRFDTAYTLMNPQSLKKTIDCDIQNAISLLKEHGFRITKEY